MTQCCLSRRLQFPAQPLRPNLLDHTLPAVASHALHALERTQGPAHANLFPVAEQGASYAGPPSFFPQSWQASVEVQHNHT